MCSLRGDLQKNVRRKQNEHMSLTFEEIWAYLKDEYGKFPDKLVHQKWLHYPPPSEWTLSTLQLFWDGYVERREAWRTLCGNVSHTEDRDCLMDKLPEWLKVEVVNEESNKRCKECWISITGLPPRLETHRIAAFVSQVISRADVSSSFEDSGLYRIRIGQEWQRSQVLDAFEGKRRTVNGNPVTVTEWTFKFRAEDVFREIKRRLGRKQELAVGRKAEGVSLSQETDKTKGGELGLAVNQVPRQLPPPSGRDPFPWPHADHSERYPGGPSPVPLPQRNNPRTGFQYGYHSNTTPPT